MTDPLRDAIQDESDRQVTLMALAHLAVERPGWEYMLGLIADRLQGRVMFDQFMTLHRASLQETPPP